MQLANQNSKQVHVVDAKRGKTFVRESRMVLALLLIGGRKWRESFQPITKRSNAKPKQTRITLDSQVKTAL